MDELSWYSKQMRKGVASNTPQYQWIRLRICRTTDYLFFKQMENGIKDGQLANDMHGPTSTYLNA